MSESERTSLMRRADWESDGLPALEPQGSGTYLRVVWQRWWLPVLTAALAVGAAWATQRDSADSYTAEVLLERREQASLSRLDPSAPSPIDFGNHLDLIRSRAVLLTVIDSLDLRLRVAGGDSLADALVTGWEVDSAAPSGTYTVELREEAPVLVDAGGDVIDRLRPNGQLEGPGFRLRVRPSAEIPVPVAVTVDHPEEALRRLQRSLQVEPGKSADLIRIRYSAKDAERSADVANAVASLYVDHRTMQARENARSRRRAIALQLGEIADSIEVVQDQALGYQQAQGLLDPAVEGSALLTAVLTHESDLRTLQFQEALVRDLVQTLESDEVTDADLEMIMSLGGDLVPTAPQLFTRLQELRTERSRLTASRFGFTDANPSVQVVDSLIASTTRQMRVSAQQSLEMLEARRAAAATTLSQLRGQVSDLPRRSAELTRLQQRVGAVQEIFDLLVERYYEAQIAAEVETADIAVADPALVPLKPDPSHDMLFLLIAMTGGLAVGGTGAVLLDSLDNRIRQPDDAEEATRLDVLGAVPYLGKGGGRGTDPVFAGKEAFRALDANLRFCAEQRPQVVAVTSAVPVEGKSTVAANLALTLVEHGDDVLVVDGDCRRPVLHEMLDVRRSPGLSEVLLGSASLADAIVPSNMGAGLYVLPAGYAGARGGVPIGGQRFARLLEEVRDRFDMILVDTPPLLAVADAAHVSAQADGTLIVVRSDRTDRTELQAAVERLRTLRAPLIGLVLNAVPMRRMLYSYREYQPGETERKTRKSTRRGRRRARMAGRT